jgi:hypothetical protein
MDTRQSSDDDTTEGSPGQARVAGTDSGEDDDDDSEMEMDGEGGETKATGSLTLAHLPVYPSSAQLGEQVAAFRAVSISACAPG